MNMAWRTRYAPLMWQLPLYESRFNRFGDIWAGLLAKRVLDHVGCAVVVNGRAAVAHERASDPVANLERETPGVRVNEGLWEALTRVPVFKWPPPVEDWTLIDCYREVTRRADWYFRGFDADYAKHFAACRDEWLALFS